MPRDPLGLEHTIGELFKESGQHHLIPKKLPSLRGNEKEGWCRGVCKQDMSVGPNMFANSTQKSIIHFVTTGSLAEGP